MCVAHCTIRPHRVLALPERRSPSCCGARTAALSPPPRHLSFTGAYPGYPSAVVFSAVGQKYVDVNPWDGNLYASGQPVVLVGNTGAWILATDIYKCTSGQPTTSGLGNWTALGLGASLNNPRGFAFTNGGLSLFIADLGFGVRQATFNGTGWNMLAPVYLANAADPNVTQVRTIGGDSDLSASVSCRCRVHPHEARLSPPPNTRPTVRRSPSARTASLFTLRRPSPCTRCARTCCRGPAAARRYSRLAPTCSCMASRSCPRYRHPAARKRRRQA